MSCPPSLNLPTCWIRGSDSVSPSHATTGISVLNNLARALWAILGVLVPARPVSPERAYCTLARRVSAHPPPPEQLGGKGNRGKLGSVMYIQHHNRTIIVALQLGDMGQQAPGQRHLAPPTVYGCPQEPHRHQATMLCCPPPVPACAIASA